MSKTNVIIIHLNHLNQISGLQIQFKLNADCCYFNLRLVKTEKKLGFFVVFLGVRGCFYYILIIKDENRETHSFFLPTKQLRRNVDSFSDL